MATDFFLGKARAATLRKFVPKCNLEREKRLLLEFEFALTDEVAEDAPHQIKRMRGIIAVGDNGMDTAPLATEFGPLTIEVMNTPDDIRPRFTLTGATVRNVVVFRPTAPSTGLGETFLKFTVHTGIATSEQVSWALEMMKATCFLTFYASDQADIPFDKPEEAKPAKSGKDAAANDED